MSQTANNNLLHNLGCIVDMKKAGMSPKTVVSACADRGIDVTEPFVAAATREIVENLGKTYFGHAACKAAIGAFTNMQSALTPPQGRAELYDEEDEFFR